MSPLKYKSRGRCNKKSCVALPRKVEPPLINIRVIILSLASQRRWNVCLTIHVGTRRRVCRLLLLLRSLCKNCGKERRNGRRLNRSRYNWPEINGGERGEVRELAVGPTVVFSAGEYFRVQFSRYLARDDNESARTTWQPCFVLIYALVRAPVRRFTADRSFDYRPPLDDESLSYRLRPQWYLPKYEICPLPPRSMINFNLSRIDNASATDNDRCSRG